MTTQKENEKPKTSLLRLFSAIIILCIAIGIGKALIPDREEKRNSEDQIREAAEKYYEEKKLPQFEDLSKRTDSIRRESYLKILKDTINK